MSGLMTQHNENMIWRAGPAMFSSKFTEPLPVRTERMVTTTFQSGGHVRGIGVIWQLTHCDRCGGSLEGSPIGLSRDTEWVHDDCFAAGRAQYARLIAGLGFTANTPEGGTDD